MNKYFAVFLNMGSILAILALTTFLLTGCSQTKVTSVWVDPEYQGDGILPDKDLRDEKMLDSKVKESGSDTILMTRIIDIRKDTQYIPPDYVYAPPAHYYGGWHGYYNRAYMVSPGYTVEYETAVLETNLYDLKSDKLIWSARSDAPTEGKMGKHIKDFARSIITQLAEAKLIK